MALMTLHPCHTCGEEGQGVVSSDEQALHRIVEFYGADFQELGYNPEDFGQWFVVAAQGVPGL